eukprot:Em0008g573a
MSKGYNRLEEGTEMDSLSKESPTKKASRWVRRKFDPYEIPFDEGQKKCASDYDSLDYDTCYNVPYKKQLESYTDFTYWHMSAMKWVLAGLIGVVTGLLAFVVNILRNNLQLLKYTQLRNVLSATLFEGTAVFGLLVLLGFNLVYALMAVLVIALEPVASGSGVPEIKSYLNGIKIPRVARITTLLAKIIGLVFSTAGGYLAGIEGPMIYIGGVVGAGISQFRVFLPFLKQYGMPYPYFRTDRDKRDFATSGIAAGVSAAFGAPIAGTLLSLEEAASYWNQGLAWRTLFCAFASTFTLTMLTSAYKGYFGDLDYPGLVGFGVFTHTQKLWEYYHLIVFIIMGAIGGLIGALFNNLYVRIQKYRAQYLLKRPFRRQWRMIEGLLIIIVTTSLAYMCSIFLSTCVPHSLDASLIQVPGYDYVNQVKDYFCPLSTDTGNHMYHNDFATVIFTPTETAISQVYHLETAFSITTLGLVFLFYYLIFCWSYGAAIAIGFFVPTILIGAIYGRFFGAIFEVNSIPFFSKVITQIYPGTYALIGSAAFVGGVTRMTISLTVLFIESTQQVSFGLPIMVTVMVAKWVGDLFGGGIHHIGINLKKLPFLDREIQQKIDKLTAEDIMSSRVSYLYPITRVRSIEQLLRNTAYSAFPVITPDTFRRFPKTTPPLHLPTCSMYGSNDGTDAEKPHEDLTRSKRPIPRPLSSPGYQRTTFSKHSEADCECAAHIRDSDGLTFTYNIPAPNRLLGSMSHDKPLILHGMILRTQLIALLKHRAFFSEDEQPEAQHEVTYDQMMSEYPRYSTIDEVALSDAERDMLMDLTLYMNPNAYTIHYQAPMSQVFTLFRTMGLRHLPVTKASGVLVGVITRHDLVPDKLNAALEEKQRSADD